jgi:hypothetical protein
LWNSLSEKSDISDDDDEGGVIQQGGGEAQRGVLNLRCDGGAKCIYRESASNYWEAVNITVRTPKV